MPYKATPRRVFNLQPAPKGIEASQAAAEEATRARRPLDNRLQRNLIRTNSVDLFRQRTNGAVTVDACTRASLAKLSKQVMPDSLDKAEVTAAQALKISSQSKVRFDMLRQAAYLVITLKGQIESNRYQLDRKRQDIQLLTGQLEYRGSQRNRSKAPSTTDVQSKQKELEGHATNLQQKEIELLETHQLALKWLRHWIRYSVPLRMAEEVESAS